MSFKSEPIFKEIATQLTTNTKLTKNLIDKTKSVIVFNLKNKSGSKAWKLDLKNDGKLSEANESDLNNSDLVITMKDLDFKKLVEGKSNSQKLFLGGKLKIKGDVIKAANIETILKSLRPQKAKL
ncbi:Non-specific lipid-transfer protein [Wickerhamomyces ciferrii]|uniref:Non-specific lipid-transfer protein n=1 Tax=Wickerhamomyces ciferrii (strain ATCC 14091 / BCRC 22168 / CBS 111 / JCM 3599 / NBRC 0793 / NRRL Y-1031 F-60-10) TaxID=1206466 RepID=K0KWT8_WICCF|nr:Non-specific lipid-transfer protein [Wickerhamomyces ciferrii]CCH45573.1 Non-specific lipid-transfer protein [Wickerhamomyces ciferrii]